MKMTKGLLLNSLQFGDRAYSYDNVKGFRSKEDMGLPQDFYGGRCNHLAKTDDNRIYMIVEKQFVIDLYIPNPEKLTVDEIKTILDYRKIKYTTDDLKKDLLTKLGIK